MHCKDEAIKPHLPSNDDKSTLSKAASSPGELFFKVFAVTQFEELAMFEPE